MGKMTFDDLQQMKYAGEKVVWVVVYTVGMARLAEKAGIKLLLIGDSLLMNLLGCPDTTGKDTTGGRINIDLMDLMILFSQAVRKGAPNTLCIGDLPIDTYRTPEEAAYNAKRFRDEAKMDAVKLEIPIGHGQEMAPQIRAIVDEGIYVITHHGTTPQTADGDYRTRGKTAEEAELIIKDALFAQQAGASMILLENISEEVGTIITEMLYIPIASLGAGRFCDIVLVLGVDALNELGEFATVQPYFVKKYADLARQALRGFERYRIEVEAQAYPGEEHRRTMKPGEYDKLMDALEKEGLIEIANLFQP